MKRRWIWISVLLAVGLRAASAQVVTTTVQDTVYRADGTVAGGSVAVSWNTFTTAAGRAVPAGHVSVTLGAGGALSVALAPNAGATPIGSYYTAVFHLNDGSTSREYWVVPVTSGGTVTLGAIRNSVLPLSVAMQTVSKAYVDTAIATAVAAIPAPSGGGAPTGAAGGDLIGTYPNPVVATVHATGGTLNNVTIDGSACGHYASGTLMGVGTCTPGTWSGVEGAGGSNLQIRSGSTGDFNARLIIVSAGLSGSQAEFHFVNTGAPSNQRNWRMSADTLGQYTLAMNGDNYATHTTAYVCQATGACAFGGPVTAPQLLGSGGTPGIAAGAAAGASPGVGVSGTNLAGVLTVTTGSGTTSAATLVTLSFSGTLAAAPQGCSLTPRNANAAGAAVFAGTPSTTAWTVGVAGSALASATTFQWSYVCL